MYTSLLRAASLQGMKTIFVETGMIGEIRAHPTNERLYRRTGLTWVSGIKLIMMISCRDGIQFDDEFC